MPLHALRKGLTTIGVRLNYPPKMRSDVVWLTGHYTLDTLATTIATQTGAQPETDDPNQTITLKLNPGKTFHIVIPDPEAPTTSAAGTPGGIGTGGLSATTGAAGTTINIPGATIQTIGNYLYIKGPMSDYRTTEKLLRLLAKPVPTIRATVWIINDDRANNIDIAVNGITLPIIDWTQFSALNLSATLNLLHQDNAVIESYSTTLQSGQTQTYNDSTQIVLPTYTTTALTTTTNNLLTSGITTRSAGLTISLAAIKIGGRWRLNGTLNTSQFIGGNTALAPEQTQTLNFQAEARPGDTTQLCRATERTIGKTSGIDSNAPTLNNDHTKTTFSVWITLKEEPGTHRYHAQHLLPRALRHLPPIQNLAAETNKLFEEAEGKQDPKRTKGSK